MDPSISIYNEKIALELKYMLTLSSHVPEEEIIATLNKISPFTTHPLTKLPPVEYMEF